ncbi:TetR/AcrR family transcriptional regulator [Rhodococcus aerolatus]
MRHTGPVTVEPLRASYRRQVREQALGVALDLTLTHGWDGVRMGRVAELTGVSRPTLYKEFGDKQGLADALALAETERFVAGVVRELEETPGDPTAVLRSALEHCLAAVRDSPLLHDMLSGAGSSGLLPQLTTRSAPTFALADGALTPWLRAHFPAATPERVAAAVDTVVRLVISHVVLARPDAVPDPAGTTTEVALLMLGGAPGPRGGAG